MHIKKEKVNFLETSVCPSPKVVCTAMPEGGSTLLNLENKSFYTLNPSALELWELIRVHRKVCLVLEILEKKYGPDNGRLKQKVIRQVGEFLRLGLLRTQK